MTKKILPNYNGEAETMLVRSEVIKNQLSEDLAEFTVKFPFMDTDYVTALEASINTARALPLDGEVVTNLKILTDNVNAQVLLGRNALSDLNTYARLAYKDNDVKRKAFGQDKWEEAASDQEKMENALETAANMARTEPFATELAAKGFRSTDADNLLTIAANIHTANILQENAKNKRPVTTQNRIEQYNAVWATIQEVSLAAKMLYRANPAKYESYLLYPNNTDTTTLEITVNKTGTTEALLKASVRILGSTLANQNTGETGQVTFSSVNIDELINLEVNSAEGTITIIEDLSVTPGTTNTFTVEADE